MLVIIYNNNLFTPQVPRTDAGFQLQGQAALTRGSSEWIIIGSASSGTLLRPDHWRLPAAAYASLHLQVADHGGAAAAARGGTATCQRRRAGRGAGGRGCAGVGKEEAEEEEEESDLGVR